MAAKSSTSGSSISVQRWQVIIVFGGGPLALFGVIWALVWLTTKPGTVPPGVARPSDAPSGGMPHPDPQDGREVTHDFRAERSGEADGETGAPE